MVDSTRKKIIVTKFHKIKNLAQVGDYRTAKRT